MACAKCSMAASGSPFQIRRNPARKQADARLLGSSCSFVPLSWTEIQAKFNRASRPLQGFPAADPASFRVE
jgi:hypothetical protein